MEHINGNLVSAFIDPSDRETISDGQGNTITLRAKMDLVTRGRVQRALAGVELDLDDAGNIQGSKATVRTSPQEQRLIMFVNNIVGWDGPMFRERKPDGSLGKVRPVTRQNISMLNPDWPFLDDVYKKINELNTAATKPDPEDSDIRDPNLGGWQGDSDI